MRSPPHRRLNAKALGAHQPHLRRNVSMQSKDSWQRSSGLTRTIGRFLRGSRALFPLYTLSRTEQQLGQNCPGTSSETTDTRRGNFLLLLLFAVYRDTPYRLVLCQPPPVERMRSCSCAVPLIYGFAHYSCCGQERTLIMYEYMTVIRRLTVHNTHSRKSSSNNPQDEVYSAHKNAILSTGLLNCPDGTYFSVVLMTAFCGCRADHLASGCTDEDEANQQIENCRPSVKLVH